MAERLVVIGGDAAGMAAAGNARRGRPDLEALQRAWIAVRANLRAVLEHVSLADLAAGALPPDVDAIAADPEAWRIH